MDFVTDTLTTTDDEYKSTIAIDFDGVIHINDLIDHSISGKIIPGVKEAIDQLKINYKIVIYSARIRPDFGIEKGISEITKFLNDNDIYFDDISICKPVARFYIDDRAIRFVNWDDALQQVQTLKQAAGPLTRKRRDQHESTHTQHDPAIDEPTLQNNYPEEIDDNFWSKHE
jgi:hypothetical protein